jgi:hypothetical protein
MRKTRLAIPNAMYVRKISITTPELWINAQNYRYSKVKTIYRSIHRRYYVLLCCCTCMHMLLLRRSAKSVKRWIKGRFHWRFLLAFSCAWSCAWLGHCHRAVQIRGTRTRPSADYSIARTKIRGIEVIIAAIRCRKKRRKTKLVKILRVKGCMVTTSRRRQRASSLSLAKMHWCLKMGLWKMRGLY